MYKSLDGRDSGFWLQVFIHMLKLKMAKGYSGLGCLIFSPMSLQSGGILEVCGLVETAVGDGNGLACKEHPCNV